MSISKVGVVGCGLMGTEHAVGYSRHPDIELVAAADPNPANLAQFGERFAIPQASRYADYRELLSHEPVDILGVVTPNFMTPRNLVNVLEQTSALALLAVGITAVLVGGGIDLSLPANLALAGVVGARYMPARGHP